MPTISTLTVDVESRTSGFTRGLKVAAAGLAALATGAVLAFREFEEAENVLQQTEAVLRSTGGAAGVTAKEVADLADALSQKAGVDDEVIQAGQNMLLTFKNIRNEVGQGNDIFNQASVAALDLAAGFAAASGSEINLKSATIQLGKALNDPIAGMSALTRVGVQFSEQQQKQIERLVAHNDLMGAQKIILQEVTSQFEGSAEAQKTASGTLSVALENLGEKIGGVLAPAITFLIDGFMSLIKIIQSDVVPAFQAAQEWLLNVWDAVKPVAEAVANVLSPALQAAWNVLRDRLIPALEKLWEAFGPILKILALAAVAFGTLVVGQVLVLITALGHLIDWFAKLVDWVRENLAEPIVGAIQKVIGWIGNLIDWVKDRLVGAWQAIKEPVLAVIGAIVSAVQTLIGWIKDAISWLAQLGRGVGPALGGQIGDVLPPGFGQNLPGAASGGFVTRTGAAVIHRGETITPAGMVGGDIVLQVDGQTFARITRDQLLKLGGRNAGTGL